MDKVVIIMPTYNEADNAGRMIEQLAGEYFPKIKKAEMHLLIVDDNSPDGTGDIVKKKMKKYESVHLLTGQKKGLGWAYVRGMKYAMDKLHADAVMEMDADFQHPPRFVKPMVEAYIGGADYVIGSRYIKGGSVPKQWAFYRKAVSFFGNLFIRIVLLKFDIHDLTTGFRLTKVKGVLNKIDLDNLMALDRFAYKVDLLYQSIKNAKKTVEVPLKFAPRSKEKSKFSLKEMVTTFKVAIILGIKNKQRFIKFGIVGFTGFLINALGIEFFRGTQLTSNLARAFGAFEGVRFVNIFATQSSWSAAFGAELAIISNFTFNNFWTFKEKRITNFLKLIIKFLQFNLTSIGAIIIQFAVVGGSTLVFGDTVLVRQLALVFAVIFLIIPYNYTIYNLFIWKTWSLSGLKKVLTRA